MAGGNDNLRDSMSANDTVGHRLTAHKDHKAGLTEQGYSTGHTLTWERTEVGDGKRLKEVRTLTKIASPHEWHSDLGYRDQDHYDRIWRKGKYAETEGEPS